MFETNSVHDTVPVAGMLDERKTPVGKVCGDGIFDAWNTYDTMSRRETEPIVPPRRNAALTRHGGGKQPRCSARKPFPEVG